jgi:hypothetical protein
MASIVKQLEALHGVRETYTSNEIGKFTKDVDKITKLLATNIIKKKNSKVVKQLQAQHGIREVYTAKEIEVFTPDTDKIIAILAARAKDRARQAIKSGARKQQRLDDNVIKQEAALVKLNSGQKLTRAETKLLPEDVKRQVAKLSRGKIKDLAKLRRAFNGQLISKYGNQYTDEQAQRVVSTQDLQAVLKLRDGNLKKLGLYKTITPEALQRKQEIGRKADKKRKHDPKRKEQQKAFMITEAAVDVRQEWIDEAVQKYVAMRPDLNSERDILPVIKQAERLPKGQAYNLLRKFDLEGKQKQLENSQTAYRKGVKKVERLQHPDRERLSRKKQLERKSNLPPEDQQELRDKAARASQKWRDNSENQANIENRRNKTDRATAVLESVKKDHNSRNPLGQNTFPCFLSQINCDPHAFVQLVINNPCVFCGCSGGKNGFDRIDSDQAYYLGNILSCCTACNYAKGVLSPTVFIGFCTNVHKWTEMNGFPGVDDDVDLNNQDACGYCGDADPTSVDRIVPGQSYDNTSNNVWCCTRCNFLKQRVSAHDFQRSCQKIAERLPWNIVEEKNNILSFVAVSNQVQETSNICKIKPKKTTAVRVRGRNAEQNMGTVVARNGIYHTPTEFSSHLCLQKNSFACTPVTKQATVLIADGFQPCRTCRRVITNKEMNALDAFIPARNTGIMHQIRSGIEESKSNAKLRKETKDLSLALKTERVYVTTQEASQVVFSSTRDPFVHTNQVCFKMLVGAKTIRADTEGVKLPCSICRIKLSIGEHSPTASEIVVANQKLLAAKRAAQQTERRIRHAGATRVKLSDVHLQKNRKQTVRKYNAKKKMQVSLMSDDAKQIRKAQLAEQQKNRRASKKLTSQNVAPFAVINAPMVPVEFGPNTPMPTPVEKKRKHSTLPTKEHRKRHRFTAQGHDRNGNICNI